RRCNLGASSNVHGERSVPISLGREQTARGRQRNCQSETSYAVLILHFVGRRIIGATQRIGSNSARLGTPDFAGEGCPAVATWSPRRTVTEHENTLRHN